MATVCFIVLMLNLLPFSVTQNYASDLVINEVMSNVKGTDSGSGSPGDRNEFVEIYNASDDTIDLSLYRISDLDATDEIIAWTDTLLIDPDVIYGTIFLPSHRYAVVLDPEYTEIGNGNYLQPYDFPPMALVVTVGNTTIGDGLSTADPIVLLDLADDTVSSYGTPDNEMDNIPYDPGDGISVERISPFLPDDESFWVSSSDSTGSTPGADNSCFTEEGLTFPSYGFIITPDVIDLGEVAKISALVENQSEDTVNSADVDFFNDIDWDSIPSINETITSLHIDEPIPPFGCTLRVEKEWKPESRGNKRVGVKLGEDEKAKIFKMLKVGEPIGEIVINEIMYNPVGGNEWLELYNRSQFPIDLCRWSIRVGDNEPIVISSGETILQSGEYIVIVEDKTSFQTKWGNTPSPIVEPEEWTTFVNSGASISLEDHFSFIFEAVDYRDESEPGVSMERISPESESNLVSNWGSSCDYRGATPGSRNSIYASFFRSGSVLSVSPNPFSPNGDGYEERALITYKLPFNKAKVTLMLYTRTGIKSLTFLDKKDSGSSGQFIWDGMDKERERMPVGLYIVYLEAVDKETGKRVIKKRPVVIAGRR